MSFSPRATSDEKPVVKNRCRRGLIQPLELPGFEFGTSTFSRPLKALVREQKEPTLKPVVVAMRIEKRARMKHIFMMGTGMRSTWQSRWE